MLEGHMPIAQSLLLAHPPPLASELYLLATWAMHPATIVSNIFKSCSHACHLGHVPPLPSTPPPFAGTVTGTLTIWATRHSSSTQSTLSSLVNDLLQCICRVE